MALFGRYPARFFAGVLLVAYGVFALTLGGEGWILGVVLVPVGAWMTWSGWKIAQARTEPPSSN
jgi:hypothetical protein